MTPLPCGCDPGSILCREAERLWRLYVTSPLDDADLTARRLYAEHVGEYGHSLVTPPADCKVEPYGGGT